MSQNNTPLGNFLLRYWWVWPLAFLFLIVLQLSDMLKGHFPTGMSICAVLR